MGKTDWAHKRKELISKLPTLLDILDRYAIGEEWWALEDNDLVKYVMPHHDQDGMFDAIMMPNGYCKLFPCGLVWNCYYRGQSSYYPNSKPSLWRKGTRHHKGMTSANQFVERLKLCEFAHLIEDYPLTHIFRNGIYYKRHDGRTEQVPMWVDAEALAQHYGIKTDLTDLTVDLWVAAFFAATEYHWETDSYTPIKDTEKYEYGVFYHYYDTSMPDLEGKRISNLQAVGLQPFGRPGKQAGYVLRMRPEENMNRMAGFEKIKFRHVADINELIFNYSNQSLNYFPEEIFKSKLLKIRSEEHLFSRNALKIARKLYFKDLSDDVINGFLRDKDIELSDTDLYSFSTHEKNQALKYWRIHEREYLDKIIIREVMWG